MKRIVKIVSVVLAVASALLLLTKKESFLQTHYDTVENRSIERTSLLGVGLSESIAWTRGGYRSEYREIFGSEAPIQRWHSASKRPIVSSKFFAEYHWSVMTPPAVLLRDTLTRKIFERYEKERSAERAKEAFADLEGLLPSTELLEKLDHEDVRSARHSAKEIPSLQDLID
jgi:hypothetical protein